jgi:radical SAM enzyme (TIGR01210 family)
MPEPGAHAPDRQAIEALRPPRNRVDPDVPYHFLHEQEPGPRGPETVNTIFLTGKECAFQCLMCDLWKNTLTTPTPAGAIVRQLDYALTRLPVADTIKLYNNGNFFDPKAVPPADYPALLERLRPYGRVIVENHPNLAGDACVRFRDGLTGTLEIAMGLETIHPRVLPALNKKLRPETFQQAAAFFKEHGIRVRAFVLLNPPFLIDPAENIHWAVETVKFAFESGADCCAIIPTRPGNGIMETLSAAGDYVPPTLDAYEEVFTRALRLAQEFGERLVFADTWDIGFLSQCPQCFAARKKRIEKINLDQTIHQPIACSCHSPHV